MVSHSRAGGNPGVFELDSRLRGSDNHRVSYFRDTTLEPILKMRLSAQGCVVPQIEILTYSVYAPFSIYGTPCHEPVSTSLR